MSIESKRVDDKQFLPPDEEEKDLIKSVENDEWIESRDASKKKKLAREYAEATIRKDKRIDGCGQQRETAVHLANERAVFQRNSRQSCGRTGSSAKRCTKCRT